MRQTDTTITRLESNALLGALEHDERRVVLEHATFRSFQLGDILFSDDDPSDTAYFPLSAMISMITEMADGSTLEYGSIGREGMLGLHVALEAQPLRGRALCQLPGTMLCVPGYVLRGLAHERAVASRRLHRLLLRYAQATINVLAQSAACNALHTVEQRAARWLLITRDRAMSDHFSLTQEFWSMMLGVRRPSVSVVAADLQNEKIIRYSRGEVEVLDQTRLQGVACECYSLIRDEYARINQGIHT